MGRRGVGGGEMEEEKGEEWGKGGGVEGGEGWGKGGVGGGKMEE